ncbi:hypothetical protein [Kitasatospora cathayae]|uniref:Uncharacterized protein n=1 Tax=Kitasatospora cathayae TaxID=3004092 RepID=A0ABY7Q9S6_9ACTN|nr:hypothetical protein [Kitasatospora sp. HUAS 3-15]WBP89194.1 hypothetical protein O1G21_27350 [Kitasatospora sp. HUAS 3-15]
MELQVEDGQVPETEHTAMGRAIARLVDAYGAEVAMMWRRKTGVVCHDKHLIPAMGKPHSGRWNTESDAVLWYLLRLYVTGNLVFSHIRVGATALKDKERRRNQETLTQANLQGISIAVDQEQSGAPCDGWVRFEAAWGCERLTFEATERGTTVFATDEIVFPAHAEGTRGIPLEIGNSDVTRTLAHLRQYGALVRWPYGSDHMIVLALNGDAKTVGLDKFFAKDMRDNRQSTPSMVSRVTGAMHEALYASQVCDALYDLSAEEAAERVFELRVAMLMAARLVRAVPLAMFVHVDPRPTDAAAPHPRVVSEEDGVTKIASRGVTVYAKAAGPDQDCADPFALKPAFPPGPYSQLLTRLTASSPSPLIAVPPTTAHSHRKTALGDFTIEDLGTLSEAVEELQRQGLEPSWES